MEKTQHTYGRNMAKDGDSTLDPSCLHNLISVSPLAALAIHILLPFLDHRPTTSSLQVTGRCCRYASPCLWNQLLVPVCQHHPSHSTSHSPHLARQIAIFPSIYHSHRPLANSGHTQVRRLNENETRIVSNA